MKIILQIILILIAVCAIFIGIYLGVNGLFHFLEELKKINEEIYYGVGGMLFGFISFVAGTTIINYICKDD